MTDPAVVLAVVIVYLVFAIVVGLAVAAVTALILLAGWE